MRPSRGLLPALGAPVRLVLIAFVRIYRLTLSGWLGGQCRFHPTCSVYAEQAVREHGAAKGALMAIWRVARCGPFTRGGVDPVPAQGGGRGMYESVIQREAGE